MVVRTQESGLEVTGLRVGAANARRYFSRDQNDVELRIGDLRIQCRLSPGFWNGQPEINDPRLCDWLQYKVSLETSHRKPIALTMVQTGANSFALHPLSLQRRASRVAAA